MAEKKKQSNLKSILTVIAIIAALIIAAQNHAKNRQTRPAEGKLNVYFIDVGQADSELLVNGDTAVLIDGGESSAAAEIMSLLNGLGITRLDCIIATHPHADHIGGLPYILDEFEVGEVIMPELTKKNIPTTRIYEKFITSLAANGADVRKAAPGDTYSYGAMDIRILSPVFEQTEGLNNMSVVCRVTFGKTSFLFTGDAEKQVEKELLANGSYLKADVLKAGHHGSTTSNTEEFINAVSPRIAVIECGDGTPSHPHVDTLAKLNAVGAEIYRTDYNGTVTVISDGENLEVITEKKS